MPSKVVHLLSVGLILCVRLPRLFILQIVVVELPQNRQQIDPCILQIVVVKLHPHTIMICACMSIEPAWFVEPHLRHAAIS